MGDSIYSLSQKLEKRGSRTARGNSRWSKNAITTILANEKYKGDVLLQKGYTADFLTKEYKKNNGELPQYYIENHHEPIIEPDMFDMVQDLMKQRQKHPRQLKRKHLFSTRIVCGDCGGWYGRNTAHSSSGYRKEFFR